MRSDPHPRGRLHGLALVLPLAAVVAGCAREATTPPPEVFAEALQPVPADARLALGQRIYRGDCANCHDRGKKGAPRVGDPGAWARRLAQGIDTLIVHATDGYLGPAGDEMPARGGNDALGNEQVAAAVHYMASLSR